MIMNTHEARLIDVAKDTEDMTMHVGRIRALEIPALSVRSELVSELIKRDSAELASKIYEASSSGRLWIVKEVYAEILKLLFEEDPKDLTIIRAKPSSPLGEHVDRDKIGFAAHIQGNISNGALTRDISMRPLGYASGHQTKYIGHTATGDITFFLSNIDHGDQLFSTLHCFGGCGDLVRISGR